MMKKVLIVVLLSFSFLLFSSNASADGSSYLTLNNERNVDTTTFDINNAYSEQLSSTNHKIASNSSLVYSDSDMDGFPELYYCSSDGSLIQYSTKDDTYKMILEAGDSHFSHTPQIADVDYDGTLEIIIYDSLARVFQCFNLSSGKEEWRYSKSSDDVCDFPQVKVLQDHDANVTQIFVLLGPGTLVILNGNGEESWRYEISDTDPTCYYAPTMSIADLDLDGHMEVVVSSWKRKGDGPRYIEIDVFSLDPLSWVRSYSVPGQMGKRISALLPPLLEDFDQSSNGCEIIIGVASGFLASLSSVDGSILWNHTIEYQSTWRYIGNVRIENGTRIIATSAMGIVILDSITGAETEFHQMGVNHLDDIPLLGYLDPERLNQGFIYGSGRTILARHVEPSGIIWSELYDRWPGSFRQILITDRKDVATELHVFFSHTTYQDYELETLHYRYWIPEAKDHHISVNPSTLTWYPNISTDISGIEIDGTPDDIKWIVLRLYQGHSNDLIAVSFLPEGPDSTRFTTPHFIKMLMGNISEGTDIIMLDMTILVPWYFVQFGNIHLDITVHWNDGTARSQVVKDWLICGGGYETQGHLQLIDSDDNLYKEGAWVRSGINATLQGITLTFPDMENVPDPGDVEMALLVDGSIHTAILQSDGEITAELYLPYDRIGKYEMTLLVANRWTPFRANYTLTVFLDSAPPKLLAFYPENGTWIATSQVTVGCSLTDGIGSGVGMIQVQFWSSDKIPGEWIDVTDVIEGTTDVEARHILSLSEGTWHIRWRALDIVLNGPIVGPVTTINIDLTFVSFHKFMPADWMSVEKVQVSVVVRDEGGSGVNHSSIEYAFTTTGLFGFSTWTSANLSGSSKETTITRVLSLMNGLENYVIFRASDAAGNTRTSMAYIIKVDSIPPTFHNPFPDVGEVVFNKNVVNCSIQVHDSLSGVNPDTVQFQYLVGDQYSLWTNSQMSTEFTFSWVAEVPKNLNGPTAIRWRAGDKASGDIVFSDVYVININQPPEIINLTPGLMVYVKVNSDVIFSVNYTDPENDNVTVLWLVDERVVSSNTSINLNFHSGEYNVHIELDDGNGNVVRTTIMVVSESEPTLQAGMDWWVYALIVCAIISFLVVIFFYNRRNC